jgi:hypothetical protein
MQTLDREIAQAMDELMPNGQFVVIETQPDAEVDHYLEVTGPFNSWKEAADWAQAGDRLGAVYPLTPPP